MLVREQTTQIQMALVTQPLNVVPEVDQMLVHVLVDMEFAVHVSFLKNFTKKCFFYKKNVYFCLLVEYGCGRTTSENCSYFQSPGTVDKGECRLRICPCSDNICQIRLDFDTFVINQPDTGTFVIISHYLVPIDMNSFS